MADPRFYDNRGPFTLAAIAAAAKLTLPPGTDEARQVFDLASLTGAGPQHLSFFTGGGGGLKDDFQQCRAGFCLVPPKGVPAAPEGMTLLVCESVPHAWALVAALYYPGALIQSWAQGPHISPEARLGKNVQLGAGVVIGPGAEIGDDSHIGAGSVIAPGVAIGRQCRIGSNVTISHACIGDRVTILPGAQIGQPGFGVALSGAGHLDIPQLGRVIVQDDVAIGACTTVDRGALRDTVIGEGTKIDNLVQVAHNVEIGRHCVIAALTGLSGSVTLGDFVVLGGQVGFGDHSRIGSGARFAARAGTASNITLEGGMDYGGAPAKPVREWIREIHAVAHLVKRRKQDD
jgi:UDP-3-O-[3-hydroxymyristoyl] glucosamine N-acyltransferase